MLRSEVLQQGGPLEGQVALRERWRSSASQRAEGPQEDRDLSMAHPFIHTRFRHVCVHANKHSVSTYFACCQPCPQHPCEGTRCD